MAQMTPSEAFVETLVAHGVTDIFGIMGAAFMAAMDIFEPAGIRFIPVCHEQGSAHMADGYARASGKIGVCLSTSGPAALNTLTSLGTASSDSSPVLCGCKMAAELVPATPLARESVSVDPSLNFFACCGGG